MSYGIWFDVPLTCSNCHAPLTGRESRLFTSHLNPHAIDRAVHLGDLLPLALNDFEDAYFTIQSPGDETSIRVIEQFECPACGKAQWAMIELEQVAEDSYRLQTVTTVPLTRDVVARAHFISRQMDIWIEANPGDAWITELVGELRR
jgi:hypothetical protein